MPCCGASGGALLLFEGFMAMYAARACLGGGPLTASVPPCEQKAYKKAEAELATMDMDVSKEIADSEAKFAAIIKRAEEMKVSSTAAKVELEKELAACRAEKAAFADLTIEEELKKHPEIAAEIEKEINKDEWFVL